MTQHDANSDLATFGDLEQGTEYWVRVAGRTQGEQESSRNTPK